MAGEAAQSRCLYIIGAQCTGKTTLVNAPETMFSRDELSIPVQGTASRPAIIREVARTVLRDKHFSRDDITTSPSRALQLQKHILDAQHEAEQTAIGLNTPATWYISDRSGLDPIIYAQLFVGEEAAGEMLASEKWRELERRMKAGVVMLCEAGCSWLADDGTRLMPTGTEEWMLIDDAFRKLLAVRGICYTLVPSHVVSLEARVQLVRECWSSS
jgi:ABC-type branched-subunit amino acid transport system ATPase component